MVALPALLVSVEEAEGQGGLLRYLEKSPVLRDQLAVIVFNPLLVQPYLGLLFLEQLDVGIEFFEPLLVLLVPCYYVLELLVLA